MTKNLLLLVALCAVAHCTHAAERKEEAKLAVVTKNSKLPKLLPLKAAHFLNNWWSWPRDHVILNVKVIAENALCHYRLLQLGVYKELSAKHALSPFKNNGGQSLHSCGKEVLPYSEQLLRIPLAYDAKEDTKRPGIKEYTIEFLKTTSPLLFADKTPAARARLLVQTKKLHDKRAILCTLDPIDTINESGPKHYMKLLLVAGKLPQYGIINYDTLARIWDKNKVVV